MKKARRVWTLLLAAFMALTGTGCIASGADGLYALPRISDEYVQLENLIAARIEGGGEYAAPVGGANRQSVQLHDLDGDGEAEAIAFLADSSHTPSVCVYRRQSGGDYALDTVINGNGSAVGSVEYADVNGDGAAELIIAWQISGDMRLLSVYSLRGEEPATLLSADCSAFILSDLDGDGVQELFDFIMEDAGEGRLVRYTFGEDGRQSASTARLSQGITEILRARTGSLAGGVTALFVESRWGNELITDVFTMNMEALVNITMASSGRSNTLRSVEAYAGDINGDRTMELPEASGSVLNWYSLDSAGRKSLVMTTYHDYENGWYLTLPEEMLAALTVTVTDDVAGETAVKFTASGEGGQREAMVTIYTLTGENRLDRAEAEGRFILAQNATTVYAGELMSQRLSQDTITECFNLIYTEWQTGAL